MSWWIWAIIAVVYTVVLVSAVVLCMAAGRAERIAEARREQEQLTVDRRRSS